MERSVGAETDENARQTVGLACRILAHNGASDFIWGHASVRDIAGEGAWLKTAGFGLEEITAERVHLVSREGRVLHGGGELHKEYPIHTEIMAARPDVGGVVHVHSRHAVAFGASGRRLLPVSHEANFFAEHGVPSFDETSDLIVTADLGRAVAERLGEARALFLVNHGIVTVGPDLQTATFAAIMLERACEQQLLTQQYGENFRSTPVEESLQKRERIYTPGAIQSAWNYLCRTIG